MASKKEKDHIVRNGIQIIKGILRRHVKSKDDQDFVHACKQLEAIETEYNSLKIIGNGVNEILAKAEDETDTKTN